MSTPDVIHQLDPPGGGSPQGAKVSLRLIAADDLSDTHGWATSTTRRAVGGVRTLVSGSTGVVTFDDVRPNSGSSADVIAAPTGTVYELVTTYLDGRRYVDYIAVTDVTGPLYTADILTDAPAGLTSSALATETAARIAADAAHAALSPAHAATAISAADNTGSVQSATNTQTKIDGLERRSVSARFSRWLSFGHSYGQLGASANQFLFHRRFTDQHGIASARNQHVSGSKLLSIGARSGGVVNAMQMAEPPIRAYNAQSYPPAAGGMSLCTGINDIQTWATVGDWAQLKEAMRHQFRAWISWSQAAAWWQHDEASTGQTFGGSGSWSTSNYVTALEVGPGSSRRRNSSSGATYTVTTGTAEAGLVVGLLFITNYTGGALYASDITITLDGAHYSTIDTRDINPASVATGGVAVARVALPNDGAAHTIVATAGTGGMEVCGRLLEVPRPALVLNVARRAGDTGYTPNGSSAIIAEANVMIADVVAEFTSGLVALVDLDTALGAAAVNFADTLHMNDRGHELAARAMHAAADGLTFTAQQRGFV